MPKYRLLRGNHRQGGKTYRKGAVVESDIELDVKFGSDKYQKVGESRSRKPPAGATSVPGGLASDPNEEGVEADEGAEEGDSDRLSDEDLHAMTVAELRELAEEEEIDLGNATRKDEIVSTIKAAQGRF